MRCTRLLLVVAAAVAVVAYSLYEPIEDSVQDREVMRIILAMMKASDWLGRLIEAFGLSSRESVTRNCLNQLLFEPSNSSSVAFSYREFAGSRTLVAAAADVSRRSRAALILIHGGGWMFGAPEMHSELAELLANRTGATVFLIRYRLAPEHPFPAAFADCVAAVESIFESAEAEGVDSRRILIGGDSAGGQLAAAVVQQLRHSNSRHRPKLQLLTYPILQLLNLRTQSMLRNANDKFVQVNKMPRVLSLVLLGNTSAEQLLRHHGHVTQKMLTAYAAVVGQEVPLGTVANAKEEEEQQQQQQQLRQRLESLLLDFRVSPLLNPRLQELQLPRTLIQACGSDPLYDDAVAYADRLKRAGVPVQLLQYQTYHGALQMPNDGVEMRNDIVEFVNKWL